MDRSSILAPLGHQRQRLLECLGGNSEWAPGYFEPDSDADIFSQFRSYAARMSQQWAAESDTALVSLLAAARLLSGDVQAARVILECLPVEQPKLDHGAGFCMVAPFHALSAALPWPATLKETKHWRAGSREQTALRAWLDENIDILCWREREGIYELRPRAGGPAR